MTPAEVIQECRQAGLTFRMGGVAGDDSPEDENECPAPSEEGSHSDEPYESGEVPDEAVQ